MRVLLLHNRYQIQGGEDIVVAQEAEMLRSFGIPVDVFMLDNDGIANTREKINTVLHLAYSTAMRERVRARIREFKADVVHVHNFFPRLTPSVYDAAIGEHIAVVQTLHNYRLMCAGGLLFRDQKICTDCLTAGNGLPGIRHRCYRGSLVGTAALTGMLAFHHRRGTWQTRVHRFITLTSFARDLFIQNAGLPAERIIVKANVVPDIGPDLTAGSPAASGDRNYALFVGRLSPEKGIASILRAVRTGRFPLPLKIVGSGGLEADIRAAVQPGRLEFLGKKSSTEVHALLRGAKMLLAPSMWHEAGVPLVIGEAYSAGVPVITCRVQPMDSVVKHEGNGLIITPGDENEMCDAAIRIHTDDALRISMGREARATYERLYQPESNVLALLQIYREAMQLAGCAPGSIAAS